MTGDGKTKVSYIGGEGKEKGEEKNGIMKRKCEKVADKESVKGNAMRFSQPSPLHSMYKKLKIKITHNTGNFLLNFFRG